MPIVRQDSKALHLIDLITPERIVLGLRARDKGQVLAELAKRAGADVSIDTSAILKALTAREILGSTGFGRGFALPHVRLEAVKSLFGLLVRLAKPIEYDAIDSKPVDVLFLLLIPAADGNDHVAALAAVSRAMRDEENLTAIRKAESAARLFELLVAIKA